jgi:hypothetical protein
LGYLCAKGLEFGFGETCVELAGEGEPCEVRHPDPEDPEWTSTNCDYDYYCNADGLCAIRLPAGAACSFDEEGDSYECDTGICGQIDDDPDSIVDFCEVPRADDD